jgi:hypothetical protein
MKKLPPQIVCAWCKKIIEEGDEKNISYGKCKDCAKKETDRLDKILRK